MLFITRNTFSYYWDFTIHMWTFNLWSLIYFHLLIMNSQFLGSEISLKKSLIKFRLFSQIRICDWDVMTTECAEKGDHPFSPNLSSEFPQVKFPPRKVNFPPSAFSPKSSIKIVSKFHYYKEYSSKLHLSNFRNGKNWLFVGEIWLGGTLNSNCGKPGDHHGFIIGMVII